MMDYVLIGGQKRPVKFGHGALMQFEKITGTKFKEGQTYGFTEITILCYVGLQWGARTEKTAFPFEIEDIADWLDDTPGVNVEIMNVFNTHMAQILDNQKGAKSKKKLPVKT